VVASSIAPSSELFSSLLYSHWFVFVCFDYNVLLITRKYQQLMIALAMSADA